MAITEQSTQETTTEYGDFPDSGIVTGSDESPAAVLSGRVVSIANDEQMTLLLEVVGRSLEDGVIDKKERTSINTATSMIASEIQGIDANTQNPVERLRLIRTQTQVLQDAMDILQLKDIDIPLSAKLPIDNYRTEEDKVNEQIRQKREHHRTPSTVLGKVLQSMVSIPAVLLEP
jgi:hypothetical protein